MNYNRKLSHFVLIGLILFVIPILASAENDPVLLCIEQYQKEKGLSYEEAKKYCTESQELKPIVISVPTTTQIPIQIPGLDAESECIANYQKEKGMSYEEAKKQCNPDKSTQETAQVVLSQAVPIINNCPEYELKLNTLIDMLNKAQGEDSEILKKKIYGLKSALKSCEIKVHKGQEDLTPAIKNPCDEAKILKENQEHLEKMTFACQQGKTIEESPCSRLSKLEITYNEMNDKIQGVLEEKSKMELDEKLASVVKEIINLKQKCKEGNFEEERMESLNDVEKAYRTKQKAVVEGTSEGDLQAELLKIEDSKTKLLLEFGQRMQELDARHTTIIKKLELKGGDVYIDNVKSRATKIKVNIKDKDIEIEQVDGGMAIKDGDTQANGTIPLEYAEGMIISSMSGKEIKVMPSELKNKTLEGNFTDIKMIDDGKPMYIVKSEKRGKMLGFIPTTVRREYRISAQNGDITEFNEPWWSSIVTLT